MVDIVEEPFEYITNIFAFFEGRGGNINHYIQQLEQEGLYNQNDPNTKTFIFKYPYTVKKQFLSELNTMETFMIQHKGNAFFRPYFCGEAWVKSCRIQTDMGYGVFSIENKFT